MQHAQISKLPDPLKSRERVVWERRYHKLLQVMESVQLGQALVLAMPNTKGSNTIDSRHIRE
uniref:Uncharacterized protein n=1 Tax=blood disease bacterium R229 TaxID=741978 RepID=G2ZJZ7_9RALS|nr:hypothetical protein BDB_50070 [blood disease bacterium R229]